MSPRTLGTSLLGLLTLLIAWDAFPHNEAGPCQPDDEGSWSIGMFKGDSPLNLTPIESVQPRVDSSHAWPVANPILTCASVEDAPSNFVADPFLWIHPDGKWYLFFETKSNRDMQGDIGVAESGDNGTTWRYLGLALDEPFHLSYPFVFQWEGKVYMLPEGHKSGGLRLYRATKFPLKWEFVQVLVDRPLIDTTLVEWQGKWWMFTSDVRHPADLEIFHAKTPLGPWQAHALNPVMRGAGKSGGRQAGRVVPFEGSLLRFGQDISGVYGRRVVAYRVEKLTPTDFKQTEVPFHFGGARQGPYVWNGMRHHHVDAQQVGSSWVAVMDGDYQNGGELSGRIKFHAAWVLALWAAALLASRLLRDVPLPALVASLRHSLASKVVLPLWQGARGGPGSHSPLVRRSSKGFLYHSTKPMGGPLGSLARLMQGFWREGCRRVGVDPDSRGAQRALTGLTAFAALYTAAVLVGTVISTQYFLSVWWDRPTAVVAVPVEGQASKFTLLVLSHPPRLHCLKLWVEHYSRCPSVAEILVVWGNGPPPVPGRDLPHSDIPIRVRYEEYDSLNNRFKPDPLIKTRGVMQLDDDILMPCADIERGFAVWRQHPDRIVGYFPRLSSTDPLDYVHGSWTFKAKAYNTMLTNCAFMDSQSHFEKYWAKENEKGRAAVDKWHNCEDILINFLLAQEARGDKPWRAEPMNWILEIEGWGGSTGVEPTAAQEGTPKAKPPAYEDPLALYVKASRRVDVSKISGVGISKDLVPHMARRTVCIEEFGRLFQGNPLFLADLTNQTYDHPRYVRAADHWSIDKRYHIARALDWLLGGWAV